MKKTCLNPSCGREFQPGHYGDRQLVCTGGVKVSCPKCHGSGKWRGERCPKCLGKKDLRQSCQNWYKTYWAQTRKPPRGMSEEEQKKVLAAALKEDMRYWSLLVAARNSALRKGELLGLTWGDVLQGDVIRSNFPLRGQWDDRQGFKETKTDSGRIAYFFEEVRGALGKIRANGAKKEPATARIWPYSEAETWSRWIRLQERLGVKNQDTGRPYRFHDLRHTAATRTLKKTGRLPDVTVLCGHKNPATTLQYTQQRPEDFVASIEGSKGRKPAGKG